MLADETLIRIALLKEEKRRKRLTAQYTFRWHPTNPKYKLKFLYRKTSGKTYRVTDTGSAAFLLTAFVDCSHGRGGERADKENGEGL